MSKMCKGGLLLLAVLGLGCDKEEEKPPPVEDKSVRLLNFRRYHTASGVEERPQDFAANAVELFLLEGETFKSLPGAQASPGEYAFADVPDGTYYLRFGNSYVVTSARRVDWSSDWLGRADAQALSISPFSLEARLDIDGLEPWADYDAGPGDGMQLVSGELNVAGYINIYEISQPGMTSVSGQVVSYDNVSYMYPFRFEKERGDRAWVNQLVPRVAGKLADGRDLSYGTVVRSLHLEPFSYDGTQPLPVSGTFKELPMKQLSLNWALSSFASHAAEAHPTATLGNPSFSLCPAAHGVEDAGWVGYSGELLSFYLPRSYATDVSATFDYGNPFPSSWGEVALFNAPFRVEYTVPGATEKLSVSAGLEVYERASSLGTSPLQPLVLAPRDLKLDGENAYSARPLALGSHLISWQPPASGQVNGYRLRLRRYEVAEGGYATNVETVSFWLGANATSVRIPPAVLKPASHYILELTAISAPGFSAENTGALYTLPSGQADTLSGLLSTP